MANPQIEIADNSVHVWDLDSHYFYSYLNILEKCLHEDEIQRANQFKFQLHRERFIISRAVLRSLLFLYTEILPGEFFFSYGEHGKPYLNLSRIRFNLSHSDDKILYAFTKDQEIGIDLEKIDNTLKLDIAKRFFHPNEYKELLDLTEADASSVFYHIWTRKEAVIKAIGQGIFFSLKKFSVSKKANEIVTLFINNENKSFALQEIKVQEKFKAAVAKEGIIETIIYKKWQKELNSIFKYM